MALNGPTATMRLHEDARYLAEFPSTLDQVISEVFNEPIMIASVRSASLFSPDQIAMAALAGREAKLTTLEAVASLIYLEWLASEKGTTKLQRVMDGRKRKRHADLKELGERTVALIDGHFGEHGKVEAFAAAMVRQSNETL